MKLINWVHEGTGTALETTAMKKIRQSDVTDAIIAIRKNWDFGIVNGD